MTHAFRIAATLALIINIAPTYAASPNACAAIDDVSNRLKCFDAAAHRDASIQSATYKQVDLLDFKIDRLQLVGIRVEIKGFVTYVSSVLLLSAGASGGGSVYADPQLLPKEDQKRLISQCSMHSCSATLKGLAIAEDGNISSLDAEAISFAGK